MIDEATHTRKKYWVKLDYNLLRRIINSKNASLGNILVNNILTIISFSIALFLIISVYIYIYIYIFIKISWLWPSTLRYTNLTFLYQLAYIYYVVIFTELHLYRLYILVSTVTLKINALVKNMMGTTTFVVCVC